MLLDFLPYEQRALRRTGLRLFWVDYSSIDLVPLWKRDNQKPIERVVVYDPRSLKQIWIADEATGDYIVAPYRIPHPDMTLAESLEARAAFRELKVRDRTEQRLFNNLDAIRSIVAKAKSTTSRRKAERTVEARRAVAEKDASASPSALVSTVAASKKPPPWAGTEIKPFADVERL